MSYLLVYHRKTNVSENLSLWGIVHQNGARSKR
jgi:hypothetical protein